MIRTYRRFMMTEPNQFDLSKLILIIGGHTACQLLCAGIKLRLVTLFSDRTDLTLTEIAKQIGIKEYPLRVLLIGLTALGVINKEKDQFFNAELTEKMLVKGKPGYFGPILGWQAHIVYPGMMDFLESLKQGTNVGL